MRRGSHVRAPKNPRLPGEEDDNDNGGWGVQTASFEMGEIGCSFVVCCEFAVCGLVMFARDFWCLAAVHSAV